MNKGQLAKTKNYDSDSDLAALQDKLFKSLGSVFDPLAKPKSDDLFLGSDYGLGSYTLDDESGIQPKNPYQELAERAKQHAAKLETLQNDPSYKKKKSTKKAVTFTNDSETFQLTNIGLEGQARERAKDLPETAEKIEDIPELDMKDVLGDVNTMTKDFDDLEELRRMIRETKKEMKSYGKDLISLKNNITEVNDYASKELGYSADFDLLHSMEYTLNELKEKKGFKYIKKGNVASTTNLKAASEKSKPTLSHTSSITSTRSTSLTSSNPSIRIKTGPPIRGNIGK